MFKIKAAYSEQFEVKTTAERVRSFFAETRNFVELMPNIESIRMDGNGTAKWTIRAEIPLLGAMIESFAVQLSENNENLIEYTPAVTETKNYLRYAADFEERTAGKTVVNISQTVELRREKAADLHFLAGLAGEKIISQQMQSRVAAMIKTFLEKAKTRLEQKP
ncbi:MAG: hypothetical protein ABI954_01430 [Pyrinomonadaceae bacterium]